MGPALMLVAITLLVLGVIAYLSLRPPTAQAEAYVRDELRWMPPELAQAELVLSERQLFTTLNESSVPVKPDQAYRLPDGRVVPVETKTRTHNVIHNSDIIQLSLQRLALIDASRMLEQSPIAPHGYVRIKDKAGRRRPRYQRAALWTRDRLEALHRRYLGIIAGDIRPIPQTNKKACAGCPHRSRCPTAL